MRVRLCIIFLVIFLDQCTKFFFDGQINQGVSFSLFVIHPFILICLQIALLVMVWRMMRSYHVCVGLIVGGGISNVIDRLLFGGVKDWIALPMLHLQNNFADWAIISGLIYYVILCLKSQE